MNHFYSDLPNKPKKNIERKSDSACFVWCVTCTTAIFRKYWGKIIIILIFERNRTLTSRGCLTIGLYTSPTTVDGCTSGQITYEATRSVGLSCKMDYCHITGWDLTKTYLFRRCMISKFNTIINDQWYRLYHLKPISELHLIKWSLKNAPPVHYPNVIFFFCNINLPLYCSIGFDQLDKLCRQGKWPILSFCTFE